MRAWLYRAVIGLALVPAVVVAQSSQERPTFRAGVEYIEVDVLVTDKKGNPVRDLTKEDFTLLEDGTSQAIRSFAFVDLPIETAESRKAAIDTVESDITTNTGEGRMYVMLINSLSHLNAHRARLIARRFVEEAVAPHDQMAVIHVCGTMSAAQGFTPSRRLMLAAVDRSLTNADADGCPGDKMVASFEVFEEVAIKLGQISGRRKVVLWLDPPSVFHGTFVQNGAARRFAQRDAMRAATRNNVAVYVVSTAGLSTTLGGLEFKAGLRVLADDTGGDVIVETNNFTAGYERFVRDNSTYYVLGYEPAIQHRDGEFHDIRVRVNRRDVTVRARRGYYAPDPDAAPPRVTPEVAGLSPEARAALRLPSSIGELGIELFAAPFKGADGHGSVVLGAHLRAADLVLGPGEPIEIGYQAMTTEGTITPGRFHVLEFDFTPESRTAVEQTGVRLVDRLELPRGRHQVRFAVHQPNGKTGSVVADVEIPDYAKEALLLSGVLLASDQTAADRSLLGADALRALLGSDPTARRRFSRNDTVTAFVEVYTNERTAREPLDVTATLTTADGATSRGAPSVRVGDPERAGHTVRLPLADLIPGEYVLTIEAQAGEHTAERRLLLTVE